MYLVGGQTEVLAEMLTEGGRLRLMHEFDGSGIVTPRLQGLNHTDIKNLT